jgi:alpha-L-arabinofuranosidase
MKKCKMSQRRGKIVNIFPAILIFMISSFSGVMADEYHVSVSGNDDNPGTKSKPFKTISAAAAVAQPGDIITVHGGIYRERVNPTGGGASDAMRIVYRASKGEKVIIKGSEVVKGWEKIKGDIWKVQLSNAFFGDFNPFSDVISGNWFMANNRIHHTGAVYLNGHWLDEAARKEEVFEPVALHPLWYAEVDASSTTIWAQFKAVDPNREMVEINVRQSVFYPEKEGINYITVSGFKMEQAATPWAPPTSEQIGLIGPHWSKGWIIKNNEICYSTCTGISLGKYGDESDNRPATVEGYIGTIKRALAHGWSKENVGSHLIRNNHIHHCEQAGIVGSLGAVFSTITGNEIHDIHVKRLFSGMEMGGIKIHGAIDMVIGKNHVHHCWRGIWLDWMAQGTRITSNLLHDNRVTQDIFVEVNNGPFMVDNNLLLSPASVRDLSQGGAYVHNLFLGKFIPETDDREVPYHREHSTELAGYSIIKGGDDRYYNNLFMSYNDEAPWPERMGPEREGNFFGLGAYKSNDFPMVADGNVYVDQAKAFDSETNPVENPGFKTHVRLIEKTDGIYLEIGMAADWLQRQRKPVTTGMLGKAVAPDLPFVQPDGTPYYLDTDYTGKKRNLKNSAPGPFGAIKDGLMMIRVWNK